MSTKEEMYYRHWRLLEKPIVLYPAGAYGIKMLEYLRKLGVEPIGFCDSSEEKSGTELEDVTVDTLDFYLSEYGKDGIRYLINSTYNYPQIEARLLTRGISSEDILSPAVERYCESGFIERPLVITKEQHRRLQSSLLELLLFFRSVCEKYNIPYYINSGTLLGAIRHKGFIPWDDDIDVAMLRKDYNRFYRVVKKELGDKYAIQEIGTRKNLALRNTVIRPFLKAQRGMIMIDTFPIDNVFPFPSRLTLFQEKMHLYLNGMAERYQWNLKGSKTRYVGRMLRRISIFTASACDFINTGCIFYFVPDTKHYFKRTVYDIAFLKELVLVDFEGHQFYAPKEYNDFLSQGYGNDYMELPPPDKRVPSHALSELKFNEFEEI